MKFVHRKEREREGRKYSVFYVLCTYIFTSYRVRERPEYIASIDVRYMKFVRWNERRKDWLEHIVCVMYLFTYTLTSNREREGPNIISVLRFCKRKFYFKTREGKRENTNIFFVLSVKIHIFYNITRIKGPNIILGLRLDTWIFYVISSQRGRERQIETRSYCLFYVVKYKYFMT